MRYSPIALALFFTSTLVQAQDYLAYRLEVIRDGKTDFSSDITIENNQSAPVIFENMATYMPKVECRPNSTVNVTPAKTGYQITLNGSVLSDTASMINMSYLYKNEKIGEWFDAGPCRFQQKNGYIESEPMMKNIIKLGKRTQVARYISEGTNTPTKSYQIFITLTAIKHNVSEPLPTGFSIIHQ